MVTDSPLEVVKGTMACPTGPGLGVEVDEEKLIEMVKESGFEVLVEWAELDVALDGAALAVTGEGLLDEMSFNGKVVGGVANWAAAAGVPTLAVVGDADDGVAIPDGVQVVSLVDRFGVDAAFEDTVELVTQVVLSSLAAINL